MITTSLSRWHSRSSAWRSSISNQATLQQPENAARRMEFTLLITISAYEAKRPKTQEEEEELMQQQTMSHVEQLTA